MRARKLFSFIILASLGYLLIQTGKELNSIKISYGTIEWRFGYIISIIGELIFFSFTAFFLLWSKKLPSFTSNLLLWRKKAHLLRWPLFLLPISAIIFIFQYTDYGAIITGLATRLTIWLILVLLGSFLLSKDQELIAFYPLMLATLVVSTAFSAATDFISVSNNPFSLGWSEGNRLWDFSLAFGQRHYDYPQNKEIFVYTDIGRQIVNGLPFIFNGVTIWMARFWWALMDTGLYAVLGIVIFWRAGEKGKPLILLGLWTYLFINQGPIHSPLVICAILVSLAWGKSYWIAVPLLVISGYFAQMSRFTWMFAPAMWILLLEFSSQTVAKNPGRSWWRSIALALAGLTGGVFWPALQTLLIQSTNSPIPADTIGSTTVESSINAVNFALDQGLLWYRLLPNATYGQGVILGLAQALIPILIIVAFLLSTDRWDIHLWQKIILSSILLTFTFVGLIMSAKIGGGGDLHNLDMLLIGMLFVSAIAWKNGGRELFIDAKLLPAFIKVVMVILLIAPGLRFAIEMKPLLRRSTQEEIATALKAIRDQVETLATDSQVLLMDQRQLLTFGYIQTPLIVEYEKKYVMDQALVGNQAYFHEYYLKLSEGYYDLIISEPLNTRERGSGDIFGEENDAWVEWVSVPTLCFYEEVEAPENLRNVLQVVMLVPRDVPDGCEVFLPTED
jgi:hypothetical protein